MAEKQQPIESEWLTKSQAASYLSISERQIDILRKEGKITFHQEKEGGCPRVYFRKQDLEKYMERNFKKIECITR